MFARARDDALDEDGFNAVRAFVEAYVELVDAGYDPGARSERVEDEDAEWSDDDDDDAARAIGERDDAGTSSQTLTSSFWIPRRAFDRPRNAVEAYVGALTRAGTAPARARGGAEWWVQDVAWDERPKVYHTDCDVEYREGREAGDEGATTRRFPDVASVLYLDGDDGGGATVVFDQTTTEEATGKLAPRSPRLACACGVKRNRVLLFAGDRWHGVLKNSSAFRGQRVTLLVNWWSTKPAGARELPNRFVDRRGSERVIAKVGSLIEVPMSTVVRASYEDDRRAWDAHEAPATMDRFSVARFEYPEEET